MPEDRRNGEPLELVYVPEPSWQPALIAFGLAGVVGAIVALFALRAWIRDARDDFNRLPRKQRIATAVLPAVPLQRSAKRDS